MYKNRTWIPLSRESLSEILMKEPTILMQAFQGEGKMVVVRAPNVNKERYVQEVDIDSVYINWPKEIVFYLRTPITITGGLITPVWVFKAETGRIESSEGPGFDDHGEDRSHFFLGTIHDYFVSRLPCEKWLTEGSFRCKVDQMLMQ